MQELHDSFTEEYIGAEEQGAKERYKNSTILFSKALFSLCDLLLYEKLKKLPKNHTERFRLLETYFPDIYLIVDELFTHYTDAYTKPILKETSEAIKNGIKKIAGTHQIPDTIKKIIA